ncbi:MAG: heme exporter protein CcmB [Rickettsiales bacterium]
MRDQLRLSGLALEWCVLAKCSANWISCHLPLILLSPLPALMFGMTGEGASRLMLSLLLGTPVLSLLGALGAALTLHAANKSGVLAVLVLPLFIPALIFGSMFALTSAETSAFEVSEFYMLCGLLLMSLPFSCWFSAWIIRLQD